MARKLRVYGITDYDNHGQTRNVVAATSMKEAAKLFGISLYYMRGYGCETGNLAECKAAMSKPGTVFKRPLHSWDSSFIEKREASDGHQANKRPD